MIDNLIKFISNIEARSFFAIFYQLLVASLMFTSLLLAARGYNVPSEFWVLLGAFTANNSSIFEFLFNKKKYESK